MNYLIKKYKGIYRLRAPIDQYNQFPREFNKKYAENDIYIDCQHGNKIFYFGRGVLQAYIPSLIRGHNIIKTIKDIIFDIEETDSEILFKFNTKYADNIIPLLKPKINGAGISPFSSKNLPKSDFKIPEDELMQYKEIVSQISPEKLLLISRMTNSFLQSLVTKKNTWENIKTDMKLKCVKGKDYIYIIGKWNEYLQYLDDNIKELL